MSRNGPPGANPRTYPVAIQQSVERSLPPPPIELRGVTVLVVDDDEPMLEALQHLLATAHARVVTARSVDEAITSLVRTKPDVIVSDINMPDRDGHQLLRMVRSRTVAEGGATPAIALSGYTSQNDKTRALLAGYQVHLSKPVSAGELLVTIRSVVGPDACTTSSHGNSSKAVR